MALGKFIPTSPDKNINRTKGDTKGAQYGHLNTIVDYINKIPTGGGMTLSSAMNTTPQALVLNNVSSTLQVGTGDVYITKNNGGYSTLQMISGTGGYPQIYHNAWNDNVAYNAEATVYYSEHRGYRTSGSATLIKHSVVYHAQDLANSRRGTISWEAQESTFQGGCGGLSISSNGQKFVVAGYGHCNYVGATRTASDWSLAYTPRASFIATAGNGLGIFSAETGGFSRFFVSGGGLVGLNTYNPGAQLNVKGYDGAPGTLAVKIENSVGTVAMTIANNGLTLIKKLSLGDGNTVVASAATPSTHKIQVVIDGITYNLLATTA
jgi:hypothetical protein